MKKFDYIYISIIFTIFLILSISKISVHYNWDEADYVNAARLGLFANYLEIGSLNFKDFIIYSLNKLYKDVDVNNIDNYYNEQKDPFLLRHFHPPLPIYIFYIFGSYSNYKESITRLSIIFLGLITLLAVFWFSLKIFNRKVAYISILILSLNPYFIQSSTTLTFHPIFNLFMILFLLFFISAFKNRDNNQLILSFITFSFLFLSLEYFLIALFGMIISFFFIRNQWLGFKDGFFISKYILIGCVISIIISFLLWPGGFLKLSFIKSFIYYIYRVFFYKLEYIDSYYYLFEFIKSQLIFVLVSILSIILFLYNTIKNKIKYHYITIIFIIIFVLFISRTFISPYYMLFPITMFSIIIAYSFIELISIKRIRVIIFILFYLFIINFLVQNVNIITSDDEFYKDISIINNLIPDNKVILTDDKSTFGIYLPSKNITRIYIDKKGREYIKHDSSYQDINYEYIKNNVDYILFEKRKYIDLSFINDDSCRRIYTNAVVLIECNYLNS